MKKKLLFTSLFVFIGIILFGILNVSASTLAGGSYGSRFTWTIDSEGNFTVNGSGSLFDDSEEFPSFTYPWDNYKHLIRTITVEEGVTYIAEGAFVNCALLEEVVIADSVYYISDYAFYGNKSLKTVYLGSGIENVPAFLESWYEGNNISDIYYNGTEIEWSEIVSEYFYTEATIHFEKAVVGSGKCGPYLSWFLDDTGRMKIWGTGEMTEWGGSSYSIPWYLHTDDIKTIIIEEGVTSIGSWAFDECSNLKSVTLPKTLEIIGGCTFRYCENLEFITIPDKVSALGQGIFFMCTGLKEVTLSNKITEIPREAFYGCSSLQKIVIPNSVKTINADAFMECRSLKSATLGNELEIIGEGAFQRCSGLMAIDIPDSVTYLGDYSFSDCSKLTDVKIGNGVKVIYWRTFSGNDMSIVNLTLGKGIELIEEYAFYGIETLEKVSIGNGGVTFETQAFGGCTNLKSFTLGDTQLSTPGDDIEWGYLAFSGCTALESIVVPDGVTRISVGVFEGCKNLRQITLPYSLAFIGDTSFENCDALTDVYYTGTPEEWDWLYIYQPTTNQPLLSANFHYVYTIVAKGTCGENLTWKIDSNGRLVISGNGDMTFESEYDPPWDEYRYDIKTVVIGPDVTSIAPGAFNDCHNLENVFLGENVTAIGHSAFAYTGLKGIIIPDKIKVIGNSVFSNCESLKEVELGRYVETIGDSAFHACNSLKEIELVDYVRTIGDSAFSNSGLTSIDIPANVRTIGDYAFSNCKELTAINIGSGVTHIGNYAFSNSGLISVSLPHDLESIGKGVFDNCSNFESITVSTGNTHFCVVDGVLFTYDKTRLILCPVKANISSYTLPEETLIIEDFAFYNCTSLKTVVLSEKLTTIKANAFANSGIVAIDMPLSVETVGEYAFSGCSDLKTVNLSENLTDIGRYTFFNSGIVAIDMPSSVETVGEYAFSGCSDLKTVNLSENLTGIGSGAFLFCGLASVTIPDSLTVIGESCFAGCSYLKNITLGKNVVVIGERAFANCAYNLSINIPASVTTIKYSAFAETRPTLYIEDLSSWCETSWEPGDCWEWTIYIEGELPKNLIIPDDVTTIGAYVFSRMQNLESVEIGENIQSIGVGAFSNCRNLKTVSSNSPVFNLTHSFGGCNLDTIYLGDDVTAFYGGEDDDYMFMFKEGSVKELYLGFGIKKIFYHTYENAAAVKKIIYPGNERDWSLIEVALSYPEEIEIIFLNTPRVINQGTCGKNLNWSLENSGILTISGTGPMYDYWEAYEEDYDGFWWEWVEAYLPGWYIYANTPAIEKIIVEEGVTTIGNYAFYNCSNVSEIVLPESVTRIGDYAFYNCDSISNIPILSGAESIGKYAFSSCDAMTDITIPENIVSLGDHCFRYCRNLEKIVLPPNITNIENGLFENCTALTRIDIPEGVLYIKERAFSGCRSLKEINLPDSLSAIYDEAFEDCLSIDNIVFPENVVIYEYGIFSGCRSLKTITIKNPKVQFNSFLTVGKVYFYGTPEQWDNPDDVNFIEANEIIYVKNIRASVSEDGKAFTVNPVNIDAGKTVIVALYKDNIFVEMQSAIYKSETLEFTTTKEYDNVKIMAWEDLINLTPIAEPKKI